MRVTPAVKNRVLISVDPGAGPRQDQGLERDQADEPAAGIDDVAVIDRLAIGGLVAEPVD